MRDMALKAFSIAMDLKPDLLVFTGDFLNKVNPERLGFVQEVFGRLSEATCPCLAVPGNHDYSCDDPELLFSTVKKTPIRLLRNEITEVAGVSIVGVDDALQNQARFDISGSPMLSTSTLVLLHEPDYVGQLMGTPSLVLSGHSHGGEICLPGGIPIHTPRGAQTYKGGYYSNAPTPLYVSRGVATLGPVRLFCPPEVTLLTVSGRS
jgi:predicted MPP superfamily phosphohydrolase